MARTNLSGLDFVQAGYGQVEPNHLSAQRTGQIYAQLPAKAGIDVLQNGQFVKYDYASNEVNFTGKGEWMLVYNEVKVYRDNQRDCDFAMIADNYGAHVYSPITGDATNIRTVNWTSAVTAADPYEIDSTGSGEDDVKPMGSTIFAGPAMMNGKTMVPRVLKTNVGDIFTTNTIKQALTKSDEGKVLYIGAADGYLTKTPNTGDNADAANAMQWQIVKVYTMPDGQPGAKIMRIA